MELTVENLHFTHDARGPPQVDAVSFELRAGRTLGILGGNECGKTTLSQLLLGQLRASRGAVRIDGTPAAATSAARTPWMAHVHVLLALSAVAALALGLLEPRLLASSLERGAWSPPLLLLVLEVSHWGVRRRRASGGDKGEGWAPATMRSRGVAYVSSEHDAGQRLPPSSTIEAVIAQHMPLPAKAHAARRREVLAALQAAGFQMFTDNGVPTGSPESYLADGLMCGQLSGGQKHLVYVLSVLASRPRLLICDEMLCGLDIDRQSSMLQLLQTMQIEFGTTILFLSVDATSVQLMSHDAAFMRKGRLIEMRASHELFDEPRERETRSYLTLSRGNEDRSRGKNLRNAFQTGASVFDL